MHELSQLINDEMKPAFGVTEPGAIALAAATARKNTTGKIKSILVEMNSGMYKNGFTCGIPNSNEVGNVFAVALGVVAGNPDKGLEVLCDITLEDNKLAYQLINEGKVKVKLSGISSDIYIKAILETEHDTCSVIIKHAHENIVEIKKNGKIIFEKEEENKTIEAEGTTNETTALIHKYTLKEILNFVNTVDYSEIEFIKKAYEMNMDLFEEGQRNSRTTFSRKLLKMNGDVIFSDNTTKTAVLLCGGAIEARVIGLSKAAMSISGSGAHGIIATMPLYAEYKVRKLSEEMLIRATVLSYLICIFIKDYSGKLSAFCGCAVAAGTGMSCALVYMKNGGYDEIVKALNNMASSVTGMICDGGNQGCTMKGIVATKAGYISAELALLDAYTYNIHGILGTTPEETMKNMGLIASPGMVGTEKTIIDIFKNKLE